MEKTIKLNSNDEAIALYGHLDENLRYAEKEYDVRIAARNFRLKIIGNKTNVANAYRFFLDRLAELRGRKKGRGTEVSRPESAMPYLNHGGVPPLEGFGSVEFHHRGRIIRAVTKNQARYLEAIRDLDIVISIGPAGTGKTYLAMASAIDHLRKKKVRRIILTRPAVEAGESLGFLPGDFAAKVNPYLRPLYDALYDMMEYDEVMRYLDRGVIEVAPLAYMRGRTLNDAFVILDEAQNCTHPQMKMFLTRLGVSSRSVVTGDITQIDLPKGKKSGLVEARQILTNIKGIRFIYLDETDVVRHPLVQDIIKAYERYER
ncbi:MAG: PhoH family protein [Candidatus Omnitrophica bacterium]|nr:PhoH family protein [Candidatus Omnitrophota bacterium]